MLQANFSEEGTGQCKVKNQQHERPSVPLSGQNPARAHERTNLSIRIAALSAKRLLPHPRLHTRARTYTHACNMPTQEAAAEKNCSNEAQSIEEQQLQTPARTASMSSAAAEQEQLLQQQQQAQPDQEGPAAVADAGASATATASSSAAENAASNNANAPSKPAANNSKNRYQAAAATAAANELLRLLGDTSKQLSCIQSHDGSTFFLFDSGKVDLAQVLQLQNPGVASGGRIAPGHEKDAVCVEDICAAVRTYAMQVTCKTANPHPCPFIPFCVVGPAVTFRCVCVCRRS